MGCAFHDANNSPLKDKGFFEKFHDENMAVSVRESRPTSQSTCNPGSLVKLAECHLAAMIFSLCATPMSREKLIDNAGKPDVYRPVQLLLSRS
jgi:hypothetical protein